MASDSAHQGIRKILAILDEADVIQLALLTTQHLIKPEILQTKEDAIEIIIRYSSDYSSILNRKIVKREILFQYSHQNCIPLISPVTKISLIQKILEYWEKCSNEEQKIAEKSEVEIVTTAAEGEDINLMATKFTEWFYTMLNTEEFVSEEHFWQDCSLQLHLKSPTAQSENCVDNDRTEVVRVLSETKRQHCLFFNPNLTSDGVFGKMDAHGLVMVFVCGTLHTRENCVGVFEQIFALARDPFAENNWKIKNTRLNLKSKTAVSDTPKLYESEFNNELITLIQS